MRLASLVVLLGFYGYVSSAQDIMYGFPELLKTIDHEVFEKGDYEVSRHYIDDHNGVSHAYGYQTTNGIEIEGAYFGAHAQAGKVVAFNNNFVGADQLVNLQSHVLDHDKAARSLLDLYADHFDEGIEITNEWVSIAQNQFELVDEALSAEPIRIKKTFAPTASGVVPSWSMSILLPDGSHWYYSIVNAIDGSLIDQYDWMLHCAIEHDHAAHAFAPTGNRTSANAANKKSDGASYNAFFFPIESPNHGDIELVKDPADETASPYGWHDEDGTDGAEYTITRGNNVYASEDRDRNNQPGYSPDGGSSLTFNYTFSKNSDPSENLDAAITNLFVANNMMHDIIYHYGFDEESGNFQTNNYGRHATGEDDAVWADAQDGSGTNNANFATPPDGRNPRMQMFLWGSTGADGLNVQAPSANAGNHTVTAGGFGGSLSTTPIKGQLILVDDGTATPTLGCDKLANADDLKGNIALIERGTCTFVSKVRNAQEAGALAVIIYTDNRNVIPMGGDGTQGDITIPSVMIGRTLGLALANEVDQNKIEVSLFDSTGTGGLDSDFDNGVIAHEFGHGISNRLTGGPLNTNCLTNSEQMGEGWSDFFSLALTHQPEHKASTPRGVGTYLRGQPITGGGIRPYPYTVNTNVSPYTYELISVLSQPHGVGSVWCSMLWDLYWALIDEYGYDADLIHGDGGNNLCIQLVMDGMKLQPCNPGFTDARDAIILADKLNNGGKHEKIIWESFTGRGLGWDADGGDPDDRTDGTNGFELPPKFKGFVGVTKTAVEEIDEDETLVYEVTIENATVEKFENVTITDTIPDMLKVDESSLDCNWSIDGQILTLELDELDTNEIITCQYSTTVKPGFYTKVLVQDGAEVDNDQWLVVTDEGSTPWTRQFFRTAEGRWAWFIENDFVQSDHSLIYELGVVEAGMSLTFQHNYSTDGRDGGVVEISEDGQNWFDMADDFVVNGYNVEVKDNEEHALNGRRLFAGSSNGFITSEINLARFAGKDVVVRFRFVSDARFNGVGWYVDDLQVGSFSQANNRIYATVNDKTSMAETITVINETIDNSNNSIGGPDNFTAIARIYPNPTQAGTTISLPSGTTQATLSISSIDGKLISTQKISGGDNAIDTEALAPGTYILSIEHDGYTERHRLMKN